MGMVMGGGGEGVVTGRPGMNRDVGRGGGGGGSGMSGREGHSVSAGPPQGGDDMRQGLSRGPGMFGGGPPGMGSQGPPQPRGLGTAAERRGPSGPGGPGFLARDHDMGR